ncbi:hypothetical protein GSY69_00855 [Brevibacterium sp. 5221]|uniref:Uncharacterized protein n=1 Tax=Brevibacterium rongguiense TaxID=2695267 RepID=A0A6N9H3R7_9MICO|nr:hypothetical protein [Brevibacterium rongguiense]MYM18563.1 hypothetical protein [Brevibacterium rongguiense]
MLGVVEDCLQPALLDDAPTPHHAEGRAELGDNGKIVCDVEQSEAPFLLHAAEEVEDLRLDSDVEGGGGLIAQEDVRLLRECRGNHYPLPHPTGQLEGVRPGAAPRVRDADALEEFDGEICGGPAGESLALRHRVGDLLAHAHHRVECDGRLLEDHRDARLARVQGQAELDVQAAPRC